MSRRARRASAAYRRQVVRWHARPSAESVAAWEAQTPPPLVFRPVRYAGEYALIPDAQGLFSDYQLRAARKAFTYRDGLSHEVHPRLMALAYRIVREFRVPHLWLISGYRDGKPYGRSYRKAPGFLFEPGKSQVLLGCRHGSPAGNKGLTGRIFRARLYDRALTPDEIAQTARIESSNITEADIIATLTAEQRVQLSKLNTRRKQQSTQLESLRATASDDPELQAWTSLAQSLINLKEFIYLQ